MHSLRLFLLTALLAAVPAAILPAAEFTLEKQEDGITVLLDGQVFTKYIYKSGAKPILWPVIGPTGMPLTRAFPMAEGVKGEKNDHVHHRSFWFTFGDINGISFWHEEGNHGTIQHKELVKAEGGKRAVIRTKNDWLSSKGELQCTDDRTYTFGSDGDLRWIDADIILSAGDKPVKIGDTKEGAFGVRVAGTMKVDAKLGGKIVNSEGQTDGAAWGKPAAWVDYYGPVDGETVGIAIFNHPQSFRFPTHWHVRTYGLFAANPFGLRDFYGKNSGKTGEHSIEPSGSITLRYRVLLHKGDEKSAEIAKQFEAYAKEK